MRTSAGAFTLVTLLAVGLRFPDPAEAQAKPLGWSASVNLSGVLTTGNAEASSFGLQASVNRNWLRTFFTISGGGIRQDSVEVTTFAVGNNPATAVVREESQRVAQAENYFAELGFERRVTERFFFHLGGGYERNLFSGVERKVSGRGGVGYVYSNPDKGEFKIAALATYTNQKEQVPDPTTKESFAGARLAVDYAQRFGNTKQNAWTTKLAVDENLEVTKDLRATWDNALTLAVTTRLAFQVSWRFAYRNLPALQEIDVFRPTGGPAYAKKAVPYEKIDNTYQVSLVINWGGQAPPASRPGP
jgi:hypothetical protein